MPLRILGSRVDPLTFQESLEQLEKFLDLSRPHHVVTGNTLMFLAAQEDFELHTILEKAALVVPESSGMLWASRTLGSPLKEFTPGIDLMLALCRLAETKGHSIFLLGSAPGVAEAAGRELKKTLPALKIAGAHHGYFQRPRDPDVIDVVVRAKPTLLFVGMGMPAQEKWIAKNLEALHVPVVMGVGGSFDVLSGNLERAPATLRRLGLEWLYRLAQEPWRWRRIAQLPVFAWRVLVERRQGKGQI